MNPVHQDARLSHHRPARFAALLVSALLCMVAVPAASASAAGATHGASVDIRSKNSQPPRYPREAVSAGASGTVTVRVDVEADGGIRHIALSDSSGSAALDRAALEAAANWTYRPAMRDGEPAAGHVTIPVDFQL